jgi:hypothetical protein
MRQQREGEDDAAASSTMSNKETFQNPFSPAGCHGQASASLFILLQMIRIDSSPHLKSEPLAPEKMSWVVPGTKTCILP